MLLTIEKIRAFYKANKRKAIDDRELIRAGVLIPIFFEKNELYILFTKRTETVEHHKGQISFPGGVMDKSDSNIVDTALRETEEEIGVVSNIVEVIGLLDDYKTPSGFCITPVVGLLEEEPQFILNPNEVSEVLIVPITFFLDQKNERMESHIRNKQILHVYTYYYNGYKIWGATAAILKCFLKPIELFK